jgi:hypothetical protein
MVKSLDPHDARSPPVSQDPSASKRFWIAAPILTRPFSTCGNYFGTDLDFPGNVVAKQ